MRSDHLYERVDLRSYYLRLKKNLWLPILIAAIGAVLGLILYVLATTVFGEGRLYRAESKLYINFSKEMAEDAYPYYNDYTWRDLIVTDEILQETLSQLEAQGFTIAEESDPMDMGVRILSAAEVKETTYATLPSDIRLMIVQFTNHDPIIANAVMEATDISLVKFGATHAEFDSIEIRAEDVAQIVTHKDRRMVAILTGAVLGLLLGIFVWLVRELFNDAIHTPAELRERFQVPVAGVLLKEDAAQDTLQNLLTNEIRDFIALHTERGVKRLCVVTADEAGEMERARAVANRLQTICEGMPHPVIEAHETPGDREGVLNDLKQADAVLPVLRAGVDKTTMVMHTLRVMEQADVPVAGLLLTEADPAFLRVYYRTS